MTDALYSCTREYCDWFESVGPMDDPIIFCKQCAPSKRVRTELEVETNHLETHETKTDKI